MKQTQQQRLLEALRVAPVNSYFATYNLRIKQAPTRIKELKEAGYLITSRTNSDRSVDWVLLGSPKPILEPKKPSLVWEFKDGVARQVSSLPEQQSIL